MILRSVVDFRLTRSLEPCHAWLLAIAQGRLRGREEGGPSIAADASTDPLTVRRFPLAARDAAARAVLRRMQGEFDDFTDAHLTSVAQGTGVLPARPMRPSEADLPRIRTELDDEVLGTAIR